MGMTYISPIEIAEKMSNQIEKDIIEVVLSYGIKVDKDELVKALSYDRKQYEIGYADGQRAGKRTAKATRRPGAFFYRCECGYALCCEKNDMNYCPQCGARLMEWI